MKNDQWDWRCPRARHTTVVRRVSHMPMEREPAPASVLAWLIVAALIAMLVWLA